ncbi:DUF2599 domain-containing protein [Lentzea tibetensis]|uniref:DUF2599 domain-containing protein n=1 Tax=Lentzea tibetensis TaxID=2591470 RepID=UPI0016473262|nr:DUF2599 domain-containing protein [Lentzea tibetensis]
MEVTHETGQATDTLFEFRWRPFMWAVDGLHDAEYGAWQYDWMGSNSTGATDWYFGRTSVYNDMLSATRHTFTASMWPTQYARTVGGGAMEEMWRKLIERTPLPPSLDGNQLESLRKQLWCHAQYARTPQLGGPTWDIEASRPNISWDAVRNVAAHKCNW